MAQKSPHGGHHRSLGDVWGSGMKWQRLSSLVIALTVLTACQCSGLDVTATTRTTAAVLPAKQVAGRYQAASGNDTVGYVSAASSAVSPSARDAAATGSTASSAPVDSAGAGSGAAQQTAAAIFLEQPESEHYVRSVGRNYTIVCRAYAVDMDIRCANEYLPRQSLRLQSLPDTSGGGQTVMRVEANITRSMVISYFGVYACECVAHLDRLGGKRVSSSRVKIHIAYMNKNFHHEPLSTSVGYLQQVELQCQPPDGVPQPTVYWLKDGKEVVPSQDLNFIITNEGSLIINQARVNDEGNYTCGARNVLGVSRLTDPATVTVNVDGGWTPWSSWTTCESLCGPSVQQRTRECKHPPTRNAGRPCDGPSSQANPCNNACTVAGSWGDWTPWSMCKADCQRYRTRKCDSPSPQNGGADCEGLDLENDNCTEPCHSDSSVGGSSHEDYVQGLEPSTGVVNDKDSLQSVILYVSLCGAVAVFVVLLIVVILCVMKRLSRQRQQQNEGFAEGSALADQASDASPPPAGQEKRKLNRGGSLNQPDLTKTSALADRCAPRWLQHTAASSPTSAHMPGGGSDYTERVPMLGWEQREDHTAVVEYCSTAGLTPTWTAAAQTDPAVVYCCCGDGRSYSPALPTPAHGQHSWDCDTGCHGAVSSRAVVGYGGAKLTAAKSGIGLVIPDGAVIKGHNVEFFIACSREDKDRPPLLDKQTLLSPIMMCSPHDATFHKPMVLSFDHCANLDHGQWKLSLYCTSAPFSDEMPKWERLITLNQEVHDPPACCHVEGNQCHAIVDRLAARYCLVGESVFGERAVKRLKLAAFARPYAPTVSELATAQGLLSSALLPPREHTVRVYVLPDTLDALQSVIYMEAQLGAKMVDKPKQLFFQDGGNNLCIFIESVAGGWASKQNSNYQEIPFSHIWNSSQNYLHCSFAFENVAACQHSFTCRLQVYQKSAPTNRQTLHISSDAEATVTAGVHGGSGVGGPFLTPPMCGPSSGAHSLLSSLSSSSSSSSSGCSSMTADTTGIVSTTSIGHRSGATDPGQRAALHLQPRIKQLLCAHLDPLAVRGNDWRMLAPLLLGSDRHLSYFASKRSPTELILNLWEAHCNVSLGNLTEAFRTMGREDIASMVEREAGQAWA